jgi:DNA helicase-2/ATP-dependent DNA helicase PcrA
MIYTDEQLSILDEGGNCVIVATPGSGKTATITAMVKKKVESLRSHKGVIAISYTNKASAELRQRIQSDGTDKKSSFFGTIDKFFISEVIVPFGRHLWGVPSKELKVLDLKGLNGLYERAGEPIRYNMSLCRDIETLGKLYLHGVVVLEATAFLACHIYDHSQACRRYLTARYTDIVIDEYQDCGEWQHRFFISLVDAGVRGIAVGDIDQSIYSWAEKYPRFLRELAEDGRFRAYQLTKNHRCHPTIAHYAAKFLWPEHDVPAGLETRVFHAQIIGSERNIGEWLNTAVPQMQTRFELDARNEIAVLVRTKRTAELVKEALTIPYRHALQTELDEDNTPACIAFRDILHWLFDIKARRHGFLDEFVDPLTPKITQRRVVHLLSELQQAVPFEATDAQQLTETFVRIAEVMINKRVTRRDAKRLMSVLESGRWTNFIPSHTDEIQLMTIHKSKGLEFEVVVHLDLYQDVLPKREEEPDDANLHYVALTRAKSACIICTGSERYNGYKFLPALPSPFLSRPGLTAHRQPW